MKLHESPSAFRDAIEAAAQHLKMRPLFIEKDYWVCYVLKNLSKSEYADKVVFKGGTSLSKAYGCIQRFSEDIDLSIVSPADYNGSQLKTLLKNITHSITTGLKPLNGHALEPTLFHIM
ncbi:nucleotidyl transferase AbiEii/AbiGii toxin family protein [Flavihumibacter profundi]|uniref:nucleotidyl transferase AbiEii/AbiGii toxin family protein n=1 Tax=Flavihumibacter profundi TaxID=2716883 RepID=UPI001CC4A1E0|nr:nucleotidyl transferase AbiEii/AbiGii toxin family protein [Flavihumibacter profundi]MBZ5857545.1 nucleotidyl transferase AbiEii/AbiGii toxin family protein [Flavihumibacter profundi]